MKSNTHKTMHLLARSKDGSPIVPMTKYGLTMPEEVLRERQCGSEIKTGCTVIAVRPHSDGGDSWQVETGHGLIWVPEKYLEPLIAKLGA
ncbi:hypothetical protein KPE71_14065 [Acinetobacter soli]|nr:hypothetical protein [Acinetobacter soli]